MSNDTSVRGASYSPFSTTLSTLAGCSLGSFTATAAALLTVSDGNIRSGSTVVIVPTNAAAGLLVKGKSCWVDTIAAGSFNFNVSATAAGAPAGTETFSYFVGI